MSDWDTTTKIGSRVRGPGQAERETVIRGKSALNAAMRSGGVISTEKKYGTANSGSSSDGQRLTKVDRSDDIVKPPTVEKEMGLAMAKARAEQKNEKGEPKPWTQKELAQKANTEVKIIQDLEAGRGSKPEPKVISAIERALKIKLRGKAIGQPLFAPKKK